MTVFILPFEKMHGLGNDFILIENRHLPRDVDKQSLAKLLCDRHFGIGADGLIILDLSSTRESDFEWGYFNSDGSEAEMCGNGMRCFAKYVFERGLTEETTFLVKTKAGIIKPNIEEDGSVTVNMGIPKLPKNLKEELQVNSKTFTYTYVETGNPHCVIFVESELDDNVFYDLGPKIEKHERFPNGVNVEFAKLLGKSEIKVRIWERGCGPTLACGTGACATVVAANINNYCDRSVNVYLPGGCLKIKWDNDSNCIFLNGSVDFIYTGQFNLNPKDASK